jgi:hypothetical protein
VDDRENLSQPERLRLPSRWNRLEIFTEKMLRCLEPDEAEQINDEYEIKVTSVSPEIRSQRIGALIAELGSIEEGRGHAEEFEQWVLIAIQTVFAGHLSNIERKANGNAVQRRDIVGTNLAKSHVWHRIEKDYEVRHVVFDAKNYKSVGRDEYRQMSTYLHGQYGRLGHTVPHNSFSIVDRLHMRHSLDEIPQALHA